MKHITNLIFIVFILINWSLTTHANELANDLGTHVGFQDTSSIMALNTTPKQIKTIEQVADNALLRPGDLVRITIPGEPDFQNPFRVQDDGKIILPEIGAVHVSGRHVSDTKSLLYVALGAIYRGLEVFDVTLVERRLSVTVLGYVENPGSVDLPENATVQMAIKAAGGVTQGAQLNKLQLRRGDAVQEFDFKSYLDTGDLTILPTLQPLDVVFVPASPLIGNVQVDFDARTLTAAGDGGDEGASITVFGEVHRPGLFSLKEGQSVVDVLMRAGGVTRYAGIEQIRVVRDGLPSPFNLRQFLDTGDASLMPAVSAGDLVFVPQATEAVKAGARTVYVMGEVFKPGAYEIDTSASFLDILANAGGPTRFAETRSLKILNSNGTVMAFDLHGYTTGVGEDKLPDIAAGDAILVPEKTDMNEKSWLKVSPDRAIRIIGSVARPGRYEWSDEMTLLDIIAHAGGPRAEADASHIQILAPAGEASDRIQVFDFDGYIKNGGSDTSLPYIAAGYTIVVPELPKDPNDNRSQWVRQSSERSIYIFGAVGAPGRYAFNDELNLLDILGAAQGPTSAADLRHVRISQRGQKKVRLQKVDLSLYFQTGDETMLPDVHPQDVIYIPSRNAEWLDATKEKTVRVLGAVARPGRYRFDDSMTLLDLLAEAGGTTQTAYDSKILVVNKTTSKPKASAFDLIAFAKNGDFQDLPVVREGDTVYVPDQTESPAHLLREGLRDIVSLITIGALAFGG